VTNDTHVIALDEGGQAVTTRRLSDRLAEWQQAGRDVIFMIGGADGLDETCLQRADWRWSLSPLTLPHGLVRVILAEQLYRAQMTSTTTPITVPDHTAITRCWRLDEGQCPGEG